MMRITFRPLVCLHLRVNEINDLKPMFWEDTTVVQNVGTEATPKCC
jgi:hypothetical protein